MIELQTSVKQDDTTHTRTVHRNRGILTSLLLDEAQNVHVWASDLSDRKIGSTDLGGPFSLHMARNHGHNLVYFLTNLHITLKYGSNSI
jgi:hypothetical protein